MQKTTRSLARGGSRVPARTSKSARAADADIADAVLNASKVLIAIAARSLAGMTDDITIPQFRALVLISSHGTQRPVDLAEALSISSSGVTRLCDRLVRKGLITREPRRSADRREARLGITPDGGELVARVMDKRRLEIVSLLEGLPQADRVKIAAAMTKLAVVAGEMPDDLSPPSWSL